MRSARATGVTLALSLGAAQSALLVLTPVLTEVADDLDVSTATAGQVRTLSGLAAGATALLTVFTASRLGLRGLLALGVSTIALASLASAVAPAFWLLALAQVVIGAGVGVAYSAAVAATAEWSVPEQRSRVLALALLGPPLAWVVGMPLGGVAGDVSWRLAWIAVPFALAVVALASLVRQPATPPAPEHAALRAVLTLPGVLRWSTGELFAYSAWAGSLVFVGALFVESYGLAVSATGLVLGAGALAYVPGNLLFRRWVDVHPRRLLVSLALAAAVTVAVLGTVRVDAWWSLGIFAVLAFLAGGRTLAGSARGLELGPRVRLGVTGVRTAALQLGYFVGAAIGGVALALGGFGALGIAFSGLFVAAAVPHVVPGRR